VAIGGVVVGVEKNHGENDGVSVDVCVIGEV
jgi:hypothetical protein